VETRLNNGVSPGTALWAVLRPAAASSLKHHPSSTSYQGIGGA
jgi:hypothetical protein